MPSDVLNPRNTWNDGATYDAAAANLARMFSENFESFKASASAEVLAAGPTS